ncbi:MAG: hypothetical protein P1V13_17175 [Rhizobiaceae bacterium]|nr:hypothetical protein [Rhizobiaceae bacterium]|tara:strand:- start:39084 stop:39740 length:657 start_codon:yes stop_codon:yes gene_type:complete
MLLRQILRSFAVLLLLLTAANTSHAGVLKNVGKAVEKTGKVIQKGAENTTEFIGEGVEKTGDAIEKGVRKTGEVLTGKDAQPQMPLVEASYLFVLPAASFNSAVASETQSMTLDGLAPTIYYFTDRPVRSAGYMDIDAFVALWQGDEPDSYKAVPPNAAIAVSGVEGEDPIVVKLLTAVRDGTKLTFTINPVSGVLPKRAGNIALFVDGIAGNMVPLR